MKKYFLISMAMMAMLFVGCKKDDDSSSDESGNDDEQTYQELPVPVTLTETDSSPLFFAFDQNSLFSAFESSTKNTNSTLTTTVDYDKRVILKKTITDGTDTTTQDYYYKDAEKGVLDSIVYSNANGPYGTFIYTTNSDDKITKIEIVGANRNLVAEYDYTYNGDKVSTYTWIQNFSDGTQVNVTGNVSYTGDNVGSYALSGTYNGAPITVTFQYTYDNKNYAQLNVTTQEDGFSYKHNISTNQLIIDYQGNQYPFETTYNYTYNADNYPITVETVDDGSTSSTGTIDYENK